jgi:hypothetical protein
MNGYTRDACLQVDLPSSCRGHYFVQYVLRTAFAAWTASLPVPGTSLVDVAASVEVLDVPSLRSAWSEVLRDTPRSLPPLPDDATELPMNVAAVAVTVLRSKLVRLISLQYVCRCPLSERVTLLLLFEIES